MFKRYAATILIAFSCVAAPLAAQALDQRVIPATVRVVCHDEFGNWYAGSGTIVDPIGAILTNRHIVTDKLGKTISSCFVGTIADASQAPDFGPADSPTFALVKKVSSDPDLDLALLYLNNPEKKAYPSVTIWGPTSDGLSLGSPIEVVGFPAIGGDAITYTSGYFSGYGSDSKDTQNYLKTTVPTNHGSSGGAAYVNGKDFIGIPSFVVQDNLSSLSYILSVKSIRQWLGDSLGGNVQTDFTALKPVLPPSEIPIIIRAATAPPNIANVELWGIGLGCTLGKKGLYDGTKPNAFGCETDTKLLQTANYEVNSLMLSLRLAKFLETPDGSAVISDPGIKGIFVSFGTDIAAVPHASNDSMFLDVSTLKKPWFVNVDSGILPAPGKYYLIMEMMDQSNVYSERLVYQYNYFPKPLTASLAPDKFFIYRDHTKSQLLATLDGITKKNVALPTNGFFLEWRYADAARAKGLTFKAVLRDAAAHRFSTPIAENFTSGMTADFGGLASDKAYTLDLEASNGVQKSASDNITVSFSPLAATRQEKQSAQLATRLSGRILLQVQSHGEAWYVNPLDRRRFYLKDGAAAFEIMRLLALGITDLDLAKIPRSDESRTGDASMVSRLKGRILLQVEHGGNAWYVNPADGKRYFMGRPEDAYSLMRTLGLGISDADLEALPEASLE